jgi:hypothetical protein
LKTIAEGVETPQQASFYGIAASITPRVTISRRLFPPMRSAGTFSATAP